MNESKIAVIEGKWFRDKNLTIKSFFDFICDMQCKSPHSYHYEMFNDGDAFQEILPRMCETDNIRNVYVAAHGDNNGIYGSNEKTVSFTRIKNAVTGLNETSGLLHSIYFGCCLFGNGNNLKDLLIGNRLRWVAGYTTQIDFVDSTVLDALFWSKYIKLGDITPLQKIRQVVDELKTDAPGLVNRLGFKVVVRVGETGTAQLI